MSTATGSRPSEKRARPGKVGGVQSFKRRAEFRQGRIDPYKRIR
jgi:hypothetical protein